jgi:hypothetical protein
MWIWLLIEHIPSLWEAGEWITQAMTRRNTTLRLCGGLVKRNQHCVRLGLPDGLWGYPYSLCQHRVHLNFLKILELFTFTGNKENIVISGTVFTWISKYGNNHKFNYFVSWSKYSWFRWISLVSSTLWKWANSVDLSVSVFVDSKIILCDLMHPEWQWFYL